MASRFHPRWVSSSPTFFAKDEAASPISTQGTSASRDLRKAGPSSAAIRTVAPDRCASKRSSGKRPACRVVLSRGPHAVRKSLERASRQGAAGPQRADFHRQNRAVRAAWAPAIEQIEQQFGGALYDAKRIIAVNDHVSPAKDTVTAELALQLRKWTKERGVRLYDVGDNGICHVLVPERGHVQPGSTLVCSDSHTCTIGAFASF